MAHRSRHRFRRRLWASIPALLFATRLSYWDAVDRDRCTGVLIANDESVAQQVSGDLAPDGYVNIADACTYGTAAAAGGIYLTGLFTHDEHAKRTGVLAAEASIDSFLLYGSMKLIFNRQRPYTRPGDGKFFAGNFSSWLVPFRTLGVSHGRSPRSWLTSIRSGPCNSRCTAWRQRLSTTRVTGGQHFPSDVFVGSTLGFLVGRYVANKDKHAHHPAHSSNKVTRLPSACPRTCQLCSEPALNHNTERLRIAPQPRKSI